MTRTGRCPVPIGRSDAPLADTSDVPVGWRTAADPKAPRPPVTPRGARTAPGLVADAPRLAATPAPEGTPRDRIGRRHFDSGPARANGSDLPGPAPPCPPFRGTAHAGNTAPSRLQRLRFQPTCPPPGRFAPRSARHPGGYRLPGRPLAGARAPEGSAQPDKDIVPATKGLPAGSSAVPCGTIVGGRSLPANLRPSRRGPKPEKAPNEAAKTAIAPVRAGNYVRFETPFAAIRNARPTAVFCA